MTVLNFAARTLFSSLNVPKPFFTHKRHFWGWLNAVANKVDEYRIEEVGPDRAAAEWLLRCGASVRWAGTERKLTDYNALPPGEFRWWHIEEIDATDSCVMSTGFPHLKGLKHVKKIVLHRCSSVDDAALPYLSLVKDTLEELQVSSCGNVTDTGVCSLDTLTGLRKLMLYDLPEVKSKEKCVEHLKKTLVDCDVEFPYAHPEEVKKT